MAKYGEAAELASRFLAGARAITPRDAWNEAVAHVFPNSPSSQVKGCPRDTFLALCEIGVINNVPAGTYTRSIKNKGYAIRAIALLRKNPNMHDDQKRLWHSVTDGADKIHNMQMDVVTTLWRKNLIGK